MAESLMTGSQLLKLLAVCTLLLSGSALAATPAIPEHPDDNRSVRTASSPKWLAAVGRFQTQWVVSETATQRKLDGKDCSISLVNLLVADSVAGITAGHCAVKIMDFSPESYDPKNPVIDPDVRQSVTFTTRNGKQIDRKISKIHYIAVSPRKDVAVVEFDRPVPVKDIEPLIVRTLEKAYTWEYKTHKPDGTPIKGHDNPFDDIIDRSYPTTYGVAGYSGDTGKGRYGEVMTYNYPCQAFFSDGKQGVAVMDHIAADYGHTETCYTYPGSSGGPVVVEARLAGPWCGDADAADKSNWLVPLSSVSDQSACDEIFHWNEVFVRTHGGTVGYLPLDRPIMIHLGNITGGTKGCGALDRDCDSSDAATEHTGLTYWHANIYTYDEIIGALAAIYLD